MVMILYKVQCMRNSAEVFLKHEIEGKQRSVSYTVGDGGLVDP